MSWVSVCLGCDAVTCDQCCRETADAHEHSHVAKHDHHHGHSHEHPDAGQLAGSASQDSQRSKAPRQCPCQRDRDQLAGIPVTAGLDAKTISAALDFAWLTFALSDISAGPTAVIMGETASFCCSDRVCLSGTEILRAHSVLRI